MSTIESSMQNIVDSKLYNFIESLKCDNSMKLTSLANLLKVLKVKFKFSTCSKCHRFKESGRHCQNKKCEKYMQNVKCPNCLRLFVKIGRHICQPDNRFVATTSKSLRLNTIRGVGMFHNGVFVHIFHIPCILQPSPYEVLYKNK